MPSFGHGFNYLKGTFQLRMRVLPESHYYVSSLLLACSIIQAQTGTLTDAR